MIPKFRGYIKSIEKIVDVTEIDLKNKMVTLDIATNKVNPEWSFWWKETELSFGDVILMQSTGLEDKNGVEIFEGDILKIRTRGIAVVKTKDGNSTVKYKSRFNSTTTATLLHFMDMDKVEILGNIYENKELLED